ncbi:MAG TPA: hypothetical protein VGL77_14920 [Armatimonadota bacterium]|jgi:hypothetical protein
MLRVLPGLLLLCLLAALAVHAEDAAPTAGTVAGILTAKGANWVEVKADGAKDAVRYLAFYREGGFDKAMLETIKKLRVPNRVTLTWQLLEHPRIVTITMVEPTEKTGVVNGVVTAKEKAWVEVKADGKDGLTERYTPRWIGKMPSEGGGLDKEVLAAIEKLKVGDHVTLTWSYDERKRVLSIELTRG